MSNSFQKEGFQFDRIETPSNLRGAKVYEVFYHQEYIGYMWDIMGRWHADLTTSFHYGHKPTVQGFDMIECAKALRDGLRGR